MTEAEWLACDDPKAILGHLRDIAKMQRTKAGKRRLRLFGCACCRRVWGHLASVELCRKYVEIAEAYADGKAKTSELEHLVYELSEPKLPIHSPAYYACAAARAACAPSLTFLDQVHDLVATARGREMKREAIAQAALLRDIFGNPFRPIAFAPSWRTDTALALARQMYDSRDFGAMPILADALQDAGCEEPAILDHCRDPNQVHVRGCWVTDLVLGKQ